MSFWIMICIMFLAGMLGGFINFLLPANSSADTGKFIRPWWQCMVLGIGATLLVPLFLEIAQSKLLDDTHFGWQWNKTSTADSTGQHRTDTLFITSTLDSNTKNIKRDTAFSKNKVPENRSAAALKNDLPNPGKSYFLYAAYCLLAAAAGFRFINMLIKNVVKEDEVKALKTANKSLQEKNDLEDQQNRINAQQEEQKMSQTLMAKKVEEMKNQGDLTNLLDTSFKADLLPVIGPITHKDDPQKGRFGGKSTSNNRRLSADVKESNVPDFYHVTIQVESTDPQKFPLEGDVIFYIHDSFTPSVFTVKSKDGVVKDDRILSYGAFTVGAVADNGQTLLELDLAEVPAFPKKFRER